ncbi:S53 family peptidase [Microbacterium terrisoli]|uniref:S53 family peptidase n=1 Tax=Microbacterium terrisoli TaxID=3242192 RepID=UPI00280585F0|nr:S53 family peptidase [Microbacterium protaetiae]
MKQKTMMFALAAAAALVAVSAVPAAATTSSSQWNYQVHPIAIRSHFSPGSVSHALPTGPADCLTATDGEFACQTPDSIRAAYNIPAEIDGVPAGTGQTIVIVDAFGSPTVRQDLATFSQAFGLPAAHLNVMYPTGTPTWTGHGTQLGWAQETSLDVQWAHAVAPGATIDLIVAANDHGNTINLAEQYAIDHKLGTVMSMSFGVPEYEVHGNNGQMGQAHKVYVDAQKQGMSVFASSGDDGSDNTAGSANYSYPASDALVTSVGGTNLLYGTDLEKNGLRETVWGDFALCATTCADGPIGATGGAPSLLTAKGGSDVAYNASVYTGVLTYLGFMGADANGFYFFGGTSAGSPQWAGITADVVQAVGHRIGDVSQYAASWSGSGALYDVTVGANSTPTFSGGYSATAGWDRPTGHGTPDVGAIIHALG